MIVSYQAEGTLGRQIAEGVERVQIMDQWYDLNAAVYVLDGFSGHADRNDLAWWFEQTGGNIEQGLPRPRRAREHGGARPRPPGARRSTPSSSPNCSRRTRSEPRTRDAVDVGRVAQARVASSAAASSAMNRPISATTSARGRFAGVGQPADQGAADDQAVGDRGELRTCSGELIPNPMQIGRSVCDRSQATFSARSGGRLLALAGDPGDRDVIEEPGRRPGDLHGPVARAWSA